MRYIKRYSIFLFLYIFFQNNLLAQDIALIFDQHIGENYKHIFSAIEKGIDQGNIEFFAQYLNKRVSLNMPTGESGYFSSNQAYYIIKNFFGFRKLIRFSFTTYGETDRVPYATGRAVFRYKGNSEFVQVYVALTKLDSIWVIDKINFY